MGEKQFVLLSISIVYSGAHTQSWCLHSQVVRIGDLIFCLCIFVFYWYVKLTIIAMNILIPERNTPLRPCTKLPLSGNVMFSFPFCRKNVLLKELEYIFLTLPVWYHTGKGILKNSASLSWPQAKDQSIIEANLAPHLGLDKGLFLQVQRPRIEFWSVI